MKNLFLMTLCLVLPSLTYASSQWPNEPAGATLINDWGHDSVAGNGWYDVYGGYTTSVVQDSSAPLSPSTVMQQRFMQGLVGGNGGGGGSYFRFPTFYTSVYWGFWMKADSNYEQHPVFTKIGWIHTGYNGFGEGNQLFFGMVGDGPLYFNANYQNADTDNTHLGGDGPVGTVRLDPSGGGFNKGQWVRFETCFQPSTCPTCKNGVWKVWANGQLSINVNNLNTQALRPSSVSHITIWGGTGSVKTRDSFIWWDHEHISAVPNCTGAAGSVDTSPPPVKQLAKPTNLKIL